MSTPSGYPVLDAFHPAVRSWFLGQFPDGPTRPQLEAWPRIASGRDVLVASPTGTGKTLTGFLTAIDAAYRGELSGPRTSGQPSVLYVSPLRALAADIHQNLQLPLAGIKAEAHRLGFADPGLSIAVRTGDTPAAERTAMRRSPPDLLVTTPESLFLLLTAASSRSMLRNVRTVIVDEVHTLARDKRGAHLALSLERLASLVEAEGGQLQRIGLSATQRPLGLVGGLLSGSAPGRQPPLIVDCGHQRDLDVAIELPSAELEAVAPHGQFSDVLDRIAAHVRDHRTTLIFVNTRKMAERVAHLLSERLGDDETADGCGRRVAAHHGSLSFERRRSTEAKLRAGELAALVATSSLELGIDVGPVELVCQIGSPRAIGTFLQRVGRANHHLSGTPAGRLYPMTRDELVECTALLAAVHAGRLDALRPPDAPLDILVQQIVAEVAAAEECDEDALFDLVRRAAPYASLSRSTFDEALDLGSWGISTGRGRRGAHLHRDGVNGKVRPRRGARLAALTNGGAIPETGDYRVVLDPDGVTVGSVHEDFAVEASIGDVFLLGTHSWRVRQVEVGTVRVYDAGDAAPTVPFWLGEAPARTTELSEEVGALRAAVEIPLARADLVGARALVRERAHVGEDVADQVVTYLAAGRAALGVLPTCEHLVVERFFDQSEGTQLVVHSPLGGRVNRALGLALRKRFCVSFDFELQAAADDDTVVLSLPTQHSFPLADVRGMLSSSTARQVLTQAVLQHPMFQARWRWNCTRALVVPRSRNGQRRPIHLQRMEAEDVLAAAWPALAACQDNAPRGPLVVPDQVLVRQTVADCLSEGLDVDGLVELYGRIESGSVQMHFVESTEPSPLAHGILSGRPYTFLDGAPLEERRTRAVALRRGLGSGDTMPVPASELAPLDPAAVSEVLSQVAPRPRDADELHDLLLTLVSSRPVTAWQGWFDQLVRAGRAEPIDGCWVATERRTGAQDLSGDDLVAAECLGGHLALAGPVTLEALVGSDPLPGGVLCGAPLTVARARTAIARLEGSGVAIQLPDGRWCARHLLVRLHAASRASLRRHVRPASIADLVRFLAEWQHVSDEGKLEGRAGVLTVISQLQGIEVPAGAWEPEVLAARVRNYDPRWLDELCLAGEVAWGRLSARPAREGVRGARRGASTPSPATPLALVRRDDLPWLLDAVRAGEPATDPDTGAAAELLDALRDRGALFRSDLGPATGRMAHEVDEGLWDLVAGGLVTADAFSAVRTLLAGHRRGHSHRRRPGARGGLGRRGEIGSGTGEGRWSLLVPARGPDATDEEDVEELAEAVAGQLLERWGIVAWELWARESFRTPWREVVRALRRLEARGLVLGGRFVAGLSGEQYAMAEAADLLSQVRRQSGRGAEIVVAAADPLNVTGTIIPGPRVPGIRRRVVVYRDGLHVATTA